MIFAALAAALELSLSTNGASAALLRDAGAVEAGAAAELQSFDVGDSFALTSWAAGAALRAAHGRLLVEVDPGVRRIRTSGREADCGCVVDRPARLAAELPVTVRGSLGRVRLSGALAFDWLFGAGVLLTPRLALGVEVVRARRLAVAVEAGAGRLVSLSPSAGRALFGSGRRSIAVPLSFAAAIELSL